MKIIKKLGVKGVGVFNKGTVLNIEPGITYLYGRNDLLGGNANWAGKSTFASAMAELFYDPIIGTRQDKGKEGCRFIEFVEDSTTVRIQSTFIGGKESKDVIVNGKSRKGRTQAITNDEIEKVWSLTETDFSSYGYLDSSVPHPLVRGTTATRKLFFTSFFGLDKLDEERRIFNAEMAKIKKTKAAYNELKSTFNEIKKDMLSQEDRRALEASVATCRGQIEQMREKADEEERVRRLLDFGKYAGSKLKALDAITDLESFADCKEDLQARYKRAVRDAATLKEWELYQRDIVRYRTATDGLDMETPIETLRAAEHKLQQYRSVKAIARPTKPEVAEKPADDKDALIANRAIVKHKIEHASKFKTGTCHACGQDVKTEPLEVLNKSKARLERKLQEHTDYEKYVEALACYKKQMEAFRESESALEKARSEIPKLEKLAALYEKRRTITKPVKVDKPASVEDAGTLRTKLEVLEFCEEHLGTIKELRKLTEQERNIKVNKGALNKLQDQYAQQQARLDVHNAVKNKAGDIRKRLAVLEASVAQEAALQLLIDAYSEKAIKRMVIESISQHLMRLVNQYAALVFDDYRFEFVWGSQIQILAHRPSGVTDVRKLSGAESKLFTIVLVLAMLAFVPKRKRLSLLILDEPTASFSAETVVLFQKLLPHLNQIIPSILVVTPKSEERLDNAIEYTVHRTKEGASLVRKHPEEI